MGLSGRSISRQEIGALTTSGRNQIVSEMLKISDLRELGSTHRPMRSSESRRQTILWSAPAEVVLTLFLRLRLWEAK